MANVKITQLPSATTPLTGTEVFPLVQGTTTKQVAITGLFTSPVMTNPTLGTVGQADLINATGLPIASGVSGLGAGIATFLGTPSSANLRTAVTDETGTGSLVFANSPALITPDLGTPTFLVATNATGTALGLIAGSAITNANLTGAVTSVGNATSLGSFTSAQLRTALTDVTGSGVAVFATSPTLVTPVLGTPQSGDFSTGTFTWPTFNQNTTGTAAGLSATLAIASGGTAATTAASAIENLLPAYAGNGSKGLRLNSGATALEWVADGGGTVISVGASVPSFLSIAGSPITTSGTLAISLSGTALPTTSGGTGLTSFTSGGVVYASSTSALATGSTLVFNANGLGVGAAPNISPSAPYYNLNVGSGGGGGIISSGEDTYFTSNLYITGGNNYFAVTGPAYGSYYNQSSGNHTWKSSTAAGTGGNVATLTDLMKLTQAGNLGIGTSSPSSFLADANKLVVGTGTGSNGLSIYSGNASLGRIAFADGTSGGDPYAGLIDYSHSDNSMRFSTNGGTEALRINSSQNVGIGTNSPTTLVDLVRSSTSGSDATMPNLFVRNTSATQGNGSSTFNQAVSLVSAGNGTVAGGIRAAYDSAGSYGTGMQLFVNSTNPLQFYTNGSEKMRLDSAGNLGLGVTPSAWNFGNALEINTAGNGLWATSTATVIGNNFYYNSGYKYAANGYASYLLQSSGGFAFNIAGNNTSGANAVASFTTAMLLDASGNLGVGTTSPAAKIDVRGTSTTAFGSRNGVLLFNTNSSGNQSNIIGFGSTGSATAACFISTDNPADGSGIYALTLGATTSSGVINFLTNGSERARIDSSGNLLVGTTSGTQNRFVKSIADDFVLRIQNTSTTGPYVLELMVPDAAANDTSYVYWIARNVSTNRAFLYGNGGLANYSANDVNLSDRREKTNFSPATSYLDKICAIPVQTFNYIDQNLETDDGLTLGVVAQDVQAVAPELVMESNWGTQEDPKMRLSIYQTDLQYALMKCIQEQQAIIESLKARLDAANL